MADDADDSERRDAVGQGAGSLADAAVRRTLLESHQSLLRFLQRRMRNRAEAEEVLQRFALRALEKASDLRDVRMVRGWLGRILATTIADHQRRAVVQRRREVAMDPSITEALAVEPDPDLDQAVCGCLYQLLPTLRPDYAEVIWRADLLGEPRERLAVSLGTTVNNITVRLHRARQALKRRLEEMCLTCPVHGFLNCSCAEANRIRNLRDSDPR